MNGQAKYRYTGDLTLPIPAEGITQGQPFEQGGFFGFAQVGAWDDETFTLKRSGIFACEITATGNIAIGDAIFYDGEAVGAKFSNTLGRLVGYAAGELADTETAKINVVVDIYGRGIDLGTDVGAGA